MYCALVRDFKIKLSFSIEFLTWSTEKCNWCKIPRLTACNLRSEVLMKVTDETADFSDVITCKKKKLCDF
jgi:hypothetical protein